VHGAVPISIIFGFRYIQKPQWQAAASVAEGVRDVGQEKHPLFVSDAVLTVA
jgi:hypothetical protein